MNRYDIWTPGKHGADRAIALSALAMGDVWMQRAQKSSRRPDAALVSGPKPADFWDDQAVKPDIIG